MEQQQINIPMLRKAVEWAEAQQLEAQLNDMLGVISEWNQGVWIARDDETNECGTSYCIAGYIVIQAGYKPRWSEDDTWSLAWGQESVYVSDKYNNTRLLISDVAARELGQTHECCCCCDECYLIDALFDGTNKAEDIRRIAEELAGEKL